VNSAMFTGASGPGQTRLFHTPVWATSHGTAILTAERSSEPDPDSPPPPRRLTRRPSRRLPGVASRGAASHQANQRVTGAVSTAINHELGEDAATRSRDVAREQAHGPEQRAGQRERHQVGGDDPVVDSACCEAPPSGTWPLVDRLHGCHLRVPVGLVGVCQVGG
jgi:hypothetical protein